MLLKNFLLIKSIRYIVDEHKKNYKILIKIAKENMVQQTLRTSLGIGWVFIRDIVYFIAFIAFRYLMAGTGTIEGMSFILYIMIGLIAWNFMSECMNSSVMAIKSNKPILSSIKFPIAILPTIEIIAVFFKRLFTLFILFVVICIFGNVQDVTWWMFIYYFMCMFILMCTWNLIFSSLVAISNDFEQLYRAIISILFYTMPIMWSFENISSLTLIRIFKLNPFVYIIEGFKDACVSGTFPNLEYTAYFWLLCLVLFCIGAVLQYKLKNHYIDLI